MSNDEDWEREIEWVELLQGFALGGLAFAFMMAILYAIWH